MEGQETLDLRITISSPTPVSGLCLSKSGLARAPGLLRPQWG